MDHEAPIPQNLRVVSLLDCVPGRADSPEDGEQIAIVTLEHDGEVEQPLLLNLRDARKLAVHLLAVLAYHGSERAERMLSVLSATDGLDQWERPSTDPMPTGADTTHCELDRPSKAMTKSQPLPPAFQPIGVQMTVRFPNKRVTPWLLEVLAAYRSGRTTIVVYRDGRDTFCRLTPRGIKLHDLRPNEILPAERWHEFVEFPHGQFFRIGDRQWQKVGTSELRRKLNGKTFRNLR